MYFLLIHFCFHLAGAPVRKEKIFCKKTNSAYFTYRISYRILEAKESEVVQSEEGMGARGDSSQLKGEKLKLREYY
jgi:hypothetical protein